MTYTAAKAFNTRLRRYKAGDPILADDDLEPHTVESLKAGGFIAETQAEQPKKPVDPAPAAKSKAPTTAD